jgi:hypothetical protein
MATRTVDKTGPEWVTVQLQTRVPYWRREQLQHEAHAVGVNIPTLIADALDRVYPPKPPS